MRSIIPAMAALALLAAGSAAYAKTDPATWVGRILVELDEIYAKDGWSPLGEARPGMLATGRESRLEFALAPGTYRFVVVCESACGSGETELLDPAGARAAGPGVLVEMPKLEAAPAAAGNYVLRVAMTECAAESCAWSARLYAKTARARR